jgi:phosphatidate phosphatase APP1
VLLTNPDYLELDRERTPHDRRGWRYFVTAPAHGEWVQIQVGGRVVAVQTDRSGYLDTKVEIALEPGWHEVTMQSTSGAVAVGQVVVVAPGRRLGVVSDIDDTVMVTSVPRVFLAAWNTFVRHTSTRVAVPGMAELYRALAEGSPGTPFIYLSTGAWNTAATLRRFLHRHGFPPGPLLLTDWGPTQTGWFRSGPEHKHTALDRLIAEFPDIHWLLIGDDGQHDPDIYARTARRHPDQVVAVAIRQLTATQQVLSHGVLSVPMTNDSRTGVVPTAHAPDGITLARVLRKVLSGERPHSS